MMIIFHKFLNLDLLMFTVQKKMSAHISLFCLADLGLANRCRLYLTIYKIKKM